MEDSEGTGSGSETTQEEVNPGTPGDLDSEGTDQNTEATALTNTEDDGGEDPIEALVAERVRLAVEAERAALEDAAFKAAQGRHEASRRTQLEDEERKRLNDSFTESVKAARQNLQTVKYFTADGQEASFTDELIEQLVVAPFQKHNSTVQQTVQQAERNAAMNALGAAAMAAIPEEVREQFAKDADGKPLDAWLKKVIEFGAQDSEYVKKLKDEEKSRLLAAEARGFAKGQRAPGGTPRVSGTERAPDAGQVDLNSQSGIARALANRQITEAKYLELRQELIARNQ